MKKLNQLLLFAIVISFGIIGSSEKSTKRHAQNIILRATPIKKEKRIKAYIPLEGVDHGLLGGKFEREYTNEELYHMEECTEGMMYTTEECQDYLEGSLHTTF